MRIALAIALLIAAATAAAPVYAAKQNSCRIAVYGYNHAANPRAIVKVAVYARGSVAFWQPVGLIYAPAPKRYRLYVYIGPDAMFDAAVHSITWASVLPVFRAGLKHQRSLKHDVPDVNLILRNVSHLKVKPCLRG